MSNNTIEDLTTKLGNRETSAVALTTTTLKKAAQLQEDYNLFITLAFDEALQQAERIDAAREAAQADLPCLAGIPYAAKDIFCTKDILTSCASKMLANFISPYDATVIEKIQQQGSVLIGKTNLDEFAMGSSTEHSFYGQAINPWDEARVPGGSSGGSAIAVATRLVPYALGTDTGGSVRQPAAFCGVMGLKPTYGRVSRYGMVAYGSSLDQAGIFAHTASDLAIVLNKISGQDPQDSTSSAMDVPDFRAFAHKHADPTQLTIGLVKEFFAEELKAEMRPSLEAAIECLKARGIIIKEISLPTILNSIPCYYTIALAEASANLARYDGVRYGYRDETASSVEELYYLSRSQGFGAEVKKRILLGTYVLTSGYYDAYYRKAQQIRRLIRQDFIDAFQEVDIIAGPVTPTPAFKQGEKADSLSMYLQDIYTVPANLAGLPAMSIPIGFVSNLPVGMQLIGNYFDEARMLAVADWYQQATDWHNKMPPKI